jgi:[acyl-carrier-protein] S-malonyltransferase
VAGHSLGEYSALVAAGGLNFAEALKAVRYRGQAMQRATPVGTGAMAAYIGSQAERVAEICKDTSNASASVQIVNFNSRTQLVLSGHKEAVNKATEQIVAEKLGKAIALSVSAPFHSKLMAPAALAMGDYFGENKPLHLNCNLVANVNAKIYSKNDYTTHLLVEQIAQPVLWTQTLDTIVKWLNDGGVQQPERTWIEMGAGSVLQGLLKKTLTGEQCLATNELAQLKLLLES